MSVSYINLSQVTYRTMNFAFICKPDISGQIPDAIAYYVQLGTFFIVIIIEYAVKDAPDL